MRQLLYLLCHYKLQKFAITGLAMSYCLTQNYLSGQLRSEELAVENIVRSLTTVQQPLRRFRGRGMVMTHVFCHCLRS